MRTWRNLAAANDPSAWFDVNGVWPTPRGTYESAARGDSGTSMSATGAVTVSTRYAFQAKTLSSRREYVLMSNSAASSRELWEYSGGTLTARTLANAFSLYPMMAQFGDATILAAGVGNATMVSTGGNFSALGGSPPSAEIVVVQSNSVVLLNTSASTDGWHASDVADHTNWSTGESASGRLIATPGPITAAVPFGNDIIVFKANSIYRLRYVGGLVKWMSELIWNGLGCFASRGEPLISKWCAVPGKSGILFVSHDTNRAVGLGQSGVLVYLFDGASAPVCVNPETDVAVTIRFAGYNPQSDTFWLWGAANNDSIYYLCDGAWGYHSSPVTLVADRPIVPVTGEWEAIPNGEVPTNLPKAYRRSVVDTITRHQSDLSSASASCYLETTKAGFPDKKTTFNRLTPLLRRRRDLGTDSASLSFSLFRELHDTTAQSSRTVDEASNRKRFDLLGGAATDNFARFKVTFTALDVEVDDFLIQSVPAGKE